MNLIKGESNFIKDNYVNFSDLVQNTNTIKKLSKDYQLKMIKIMSDEFTEKEQQWYIANLFIYLHYHPTTDYPINLENVFKMVGFANKGNAKRTLENNFELDEDYKIIKNKKKKKTVENKNEKKETKNGHNDEIIMLNIDTFKNLCMLARTSQGKEIRKYYVKLENMNNKIMMEEIKEMEIKLKENTLLLMNRDLELDKCKQLIYREIDADEDFYLFQEKDNEHLKTSCNECDEYEFNFKTNNKNLLNEVVNYILDKYTKNESFTCNISYIKNIIMIIGTLLNTLKSTFQHISKKELFDKITEKLLFLIDDHEVNLRRQITSSELYFNYKNELLVNFIKKKICDNDNNCDCIDFDNHDNLNNLYNNFLKEYSNINITFERFINKLHLIKNSFKDNNLSLSLALLKNNDNNVIINNIIYDNVTDIFKNEINININLKDLNIDDFFKKHSNNIACITDLKGRFIKTNNKFNQCIEYTSEELYQQEINNYIINWISLVIIDDNNGTCRNTYKTKSNKNVTFDWYNIKKNNCYYCIGKLIVKTIDV